MSHLRQMVRPLGQVLGQVLGAVLPRGGDSEVRVRVGEGAVRRRSTPPSTVLMFFCENGTLAVQVI